MIFEYIDIVQLFSYNYRLSCKLCGRINIIYVSHTFFMEFNAKSIIIITYSSKIRYESRIIVLDSGTNCGTVACLSRNELNCSSVMTNVSAFLFASGPTFSPSISKH